MYDRPTDRGGLVSMDQPPRRMQTDAGHIHMAVFYRSNQVRAEMPGATAAEELQDQEPRAILRISKDGKLVRTEFFESAFSADQNRFLEEYVQAARLGGVIALFYPGLSFPEDYVLRKVEAVLGRVRAAGVRTEVDVHGYLYDTDGQPREIV